MIIVQMKSQLEDYDSISNHVRQLDSDLSKKYETYIMGLTNLTSVKNFKSYFDKKFLNYLIHKNSSGEEVVIIYQYTNYEERLYKFLLKLPFRKYFIYHNITPPSYFLNENPFVAYDCDRSIKNLGKFAFFDHFFAISEYNKKSLVDSGIPPEDISILPIFQDFEKRFDFKADNEYLGQKCKIKKEGNKILFVGRFVPHKKQEDVIKLFYLINKYIDKKSSLNLVGVFEGRYLARLKNLVDKLDLKEKVFFIKGAEDKLLGEIYKNSDIYISMSEHEGYGLPFLEAMYFGVPILAFNGGSVKDTIMGGGIVVDNKDLKILYGLAYDIIKNSSTRKKIIESGRNSLNFYEKFYDESYKDFLSIISGKKDFNGSLDYLGFNLAYRKKTHDIDIIQESLSNPYERRGLKINEKDIVMDIGAHIGCFTLYASNKAKKGKVYSFEPERGNFELLEKNVRDNKLKNVSIFNSGIYDVNGEKILSLTYPKTGSNTFSWDKNNKRGFQKVKVKSLNSIFSELNIHLCNFLKMDCEGSENIILNSLDKENFRKIEKMSIEFHTKEKMEEIKSILEENGFIVKISLSSKKGYGYIFAKNKNFIF